MSSYIRPFFFDLGGPGAKGVGELGLVPATASAIYDVVGVRIRGYPLLLMKFYMLLEGKRCLSQHVRWARILPTLVFKWWTRLSKIDWLFLCTNLDS